MAVLEALCRDVGGLRNESNVRVALSSRVRHDSNHNTLGSRENSCSVKLVAVDDIPSNLELLSESLQQEGLTIFPETDPEEGLDLRS